VNDSGEQASGACSTEPRREFGALLGLVVGLSGLMFLRLAAGRRTRTRD
jgi:hypothetical protein